MHEPKPANIPIFFGEEGQRIFKKILNLKPKEIDIEAKKEELRQQLKQQGLEI